VRASAPCTTLGVPEFSQRRAYGDSLGALLGVRADRMRVPLPITSPRGRWEGGAPIDSSALMPGRYLPAAPKLTRKFDRLRI
jgi:hypothetical protein